MPQVATMATCGTHGCGWIMRSEFYMMGYSVRNASYRYTAWLPWIGSALVGNWSATPIAAGGGARGGA